MCAPVCQPRQPCSQAAAIPSVWWVLLCHCDACCAGRKSAGEKRAGEKRAACICNPTPLDGCMHALDLHRLKLNVICQPRLHALVWVCSPDSKRLISSQIKCTAVPLAGMLAPQTPSTLWHMSDGMRSCSPGLQCMYFALCTLDERAPHQGSHPHARCLRHGMHATLVKSPACPCMLHATWTRDDQPERAPTIYMLADTICVFSLGPTSSCSSTGSVRRGQLVMLRYQQHRTRYCVGSVLVPRAAQARQTAKRRACHRGSPKQAMRPGARAMQTGIAPLGLRDMTRDSQCNVSMCTARVHMHTHRPRQRICPLFSALQILDGGCTLSFKQ